MANKDILSQEEVDALLGLDLEEMGDLPDSRGTVREVDIANMARVVRSTFPAMESINERVGRGLRDIIFSLFRKTAGVEVEGVSHKSFADYIYGLYVPTALNVIRVLPLRGYGILAFDPRLIYQLVDFYYGGKGVLYTKVEGRDFTGMEQRLIKDLCSEICGLLTEAWKSVAEIAFEYSHAEVHRRSANILSPKEAVVVSTFNLELDTGEPGYIHVALPYSMLEPIRSTLDSPVQASDDGSGQRWQKALNYHVRDICLPVRCELTRFEADLTALLRWKVGQILPIEMQTVLDLKSEGLPIATGTFGVSNEKNALRITEVKAPLPVFDSSNILQYQAERAQS
jgi:flagellar motor switch protein FliM